MCFRPLFNLIRVLYCIGISEIKPVLFICAEHFSVGVDLGLSRVVVFFNSLAFVETIL
jgi:hypothetical protein